MKRITLGVQACSESLALLIAMAWSDGRVDDRERAAVRGVAEVFNLTRDTRERIEKLLSVSSELDKDSLVALAGLGDKEASFAYVVAAWMAGLDAKVADEEAALLDEVASALRIEGARRDELEKLARDLEPQVGLPAHEGWGEQVTRLFRQIPPKLANETLDDVEVVFE